MLDETVTECESVPLSDQLTKVYWVPVVGVCGEVVAIVCWLPTCQLTLTGAADAVPPSTLTSKPVGEVLMMMLALLAAKLAVTDSGALMVTVVDALVLLATGPVQLEKL
jgi:hypothetical protein